MQFCEADKLILGICNGFQVLLKSGILLTEDSRGPVATLTWNDSGKFEDRWVALDVASPSCVFLAGVERLCLPVAHAEGKFVPRDAAALGRLDAAGQLVLRYRHQDKDSTAVVPYPDNPNGSVANVAGVCAPSGRVLGLMPHPERFIDAMHHPQWTRQRASGDGAGLRIFHNAVSYFR